MRNGKESTILALACRSAKIAALVAGGALGWATRATAEPKEPPCPDGTPRQKNEPCAPQEVVVTGTRTKESSQRATVRTETVTRDEAERRGARNVGEALAGEPSLQVNPQAYGHLGAPSGVQMQGLDGDRVLVLEDGERVIGDTGGVIDLAELPLADVDRIEYVVGPSSSLYGTNALGGVINIVTAPPKHQGPSARGRVEGRSSGDFLGEGAAAYRREDTWLELDGSYAERQEKLLDQGPALLLPSGYTALVGLRGGFRPAKRLNVRLKARYGHDRNDGLTTEDVPGLGTYLIDTPETTDRVSLNALQTLEFSGGSRLDFSLGRSLFRGRTERDRRDSPVDEERRRAADLQSFETTATLVDGESRTWVVGLRHETENFSETIRKVVVVGTALEPRSAEEVAPLQLATGAAYAQLGYRFSDLLSVMPGVRGELHDRYGAVAAPRLAVALRPSELVSLRVSGGRGFRAPSAKEYGFVFDHSVLGYRVLGNPELAPETSWGVNGDVTLRASSRLRLRVGAFGNWVKNLIDFALAPEQTDPAVIDYRYVNVDRARTAGADASVRAEPLPGVVGTLAYAYLFTRNDTTGERLANRPPHTVTASLAAKPSAALNALVRLRYVGETWVTDAVSTPGHTLLDARLGYQAKSHLEFYLGGTNLLDVKRDPHVAGDARPTLGATVYLGARGEIDTDPDDGE